MELENAIIWRVLLSRYMINISLNANLSYKKNLISVFNVSHQNTRLKHAEHYNHCISTLLG